MIDVTVMVSAGLRGWMREAVDGSDEKRIQVPETRSLVYSKSFAIQHLITRYL
jgi:hypothetical protein